MTLRLSMAQARKMGLNIAAATPVGSRAMALSGRGRRGRMPDDVLWEAVHLVYPDAVREHKGAVTGRRFRIDIALEDVKIAIEVDGWQFHGKYRGSHEADRDRQNLLAVRGWLILRFTAGQIFKDIVGVMETIHAAYRTRRGG